MKLNLQQTIVLFDNICWSDLTSNFKTIVVKKSKGYFHFDSSNDIYRRQIESWKF